MDMHLYIYSDESGVLDKYHNDYYVFGGVVFLSKDEKDNYARKYIAAEKNVRLSEELDDRQEVKASVIQPKSKNKLYRCMRDAERFGAVVAQKKLDDMLFLNAHKKSRQRYLDWLYKMAVKTKLQKLIKDGIIIPDQVDAIDFYVDEHSTATNGYYELKESLEKEFQRGIWNYTYMTYHAAVPKAALNIRVLQRFIRDLSRAFCRHHSQSYLFLRQPQRRTYSGRGQAEYLLPSLK